MSATTIVKAYSKLSYFISNIYPASFEGDYVDGAHFGKWADMFQDSPLTCILAPRKHGKSTISYGYLLWKIMQNVDKDLEILYISYKEDLARYHVKNMKIYLLKNPYFKDLKHISDAEGIVKATWDGIHHITIEPAGIMSFKRGRHPHIVILDDILLDPTTMMDLSVIQKINRIVFEDVMSLPKEGGEMKVIGTAQTYEDCLFKFKNNKRFKWGLFPAIINEKNKEVLWKEMFSYDRLMEIQHDIGEKAFEKEYLLNPVYSSESFFSHEQIEKVIKKLPWFSHGQPFETENEMIAGWDIGKKSHPSHFCIFEVVPNEDKTKEPTWIQRCSKWFDRTDYIVQHQKIQALMDYFKVDRVYFDATRGELDALMEQGIMDRARFIPVIFNIKTKQSMATEFGRHVEQLRIELLNDQRQINQLFVVTNDLEAIETAEGHGDCYDSKTEVLTDKGWKFFPELDETEKIATLDKDGFLEYQRPTDYIEKEYNGKMYYVDNTQVNLLVTPQHKLYAGNNGKNFKLRFPKDIFNKRVNFKKDVKWNGTDKKDFILKGKPCAQLNENKKDRKIQMNLWLEFLGYYISEGHTTKRERNRYQIGISQEGKKRDKIRDCLSKLPFKFTENTKGFWIYNAVLGEYLYPFGKSWEKYIPEEYLFLPKDKLEILYNSLMYGDGSFSATFRNYYTSSYRLASQFQELLLKIGKSGNIYERNYIGRKAPHGTTKRIHYQVSVIEKKNQPVINKSKHRGIIQDGWTEYKGKIHCVTVPNHIIYVRRNGKPVWSGNSFWSVSLAFYHNVCMDKYRVLSSDKGLIF